uniref:Uncharacterized protein n=1 Tax=Lotharella globosa TaxID=91324 RepID=A0A7S3YTU9_9EUKA
MSTRGRYYNPRPDAGDGTDHAYRMQVEDRYKTSANAKGVLKVVQWILVVFGVVGAGSVFAFPSEVLQPKIHGSVMAAASLVPALFVYLAVNPKTFNSCLCHLAVCYSIGCSLGLLAVAGLTLQADQSPGSMVFGAACICGVMLHAFTARTLRILEQTAGYRKKSR